MNLLAANKFRRRLRRFGVLMVLGFIAINAVAFMHARAMTHYVPNGRRSQTPEKLTTAGKIKVLLTGIGLPRSYNVQTPADVGLHYTTARVQSGDLDIETWTIPASRHRATVVVCHGYAECKSTMLPAADFSPANLARRVTCPVLDLQGDQDRRVTPAQAKAVFDAFPGNKSFVPFSGAGHSSSRLSDPVLWTRSIDQLLHETVAPKDPE